MRRIVVGAIVLCGLVATACSSPHAAAPTTTGTAAAAAGQPAAVPPYPTGGGAAVATRWWSNSAAPAGSTIAPGQPDGAAARLHPSRPQYCAMLKQTLAAGRSILPGVAADDPARTAAAVAFVTELQHVAPAEVASSWQVLGNTIIAVVRSGGDPSRITGVDAAATRAAVAAVSADATSRCGVNLSATAH